MSDPIIVALISGCFTIAGVVCSNYFIGRQKDADHQRWQQRMEDRYENIEKKLDEHNHYAERIGLIEQNIAVIVERISHIAS